MLFDKASYDKLLKEVPSYKLITPSVVSERLKVRGSLARKALDELCEKGMQQLNFNLFKYLIYLVIKFCVGLIKQVIQHHAQLIYTRVTKGDEWGNFCKIIILLNIKNITIMSFCLFLSIFYHSWLIK